MDVWGKRLRIELQGADESGIAAVLLDTADYFLKTTAVLRAEQFANLAAGQGDYSLDAEFAAPNLTALLVHRVCIRGVWQVPSIPPSFQELRDTIGEPSFAFVVHPQTIRVVGTPQKDYQDGLGVLTSYKLDRTATCVPKLLADYYYEAVLAGTLANMRSQPKRPYSDQQQAVVHHRQFQNDIGSARDEARRRWGNAESPTPFNRQWTRMPAATAYHR